MFWCVSIPVFRVDEKQQIPRQPWKRVKDRLTRERERGVMTGEICTRARTNPVITRLTDFSRRLLVKETPVLELQNCRFPPTGRGRLAS